MAEIECKTSIALLMRMQSLEQYIYVKVVATMLEIINHLSVRTSSIEIKTFPPQLLEVQLKLQGLSSQTAATFVQQLRKENIQMTYSQFTSLQTIDQVDQQIYGGRGKYSILKADYLNRRILNHLCSCLFKESKYFQVFQIASYKYSDKIEMGCGNWLPKKRKDWYLITDKRNSNQDNQNSFNLASHSLTKLEQWAVINFRTFTSIIWARFKGPNNSQAESFRLSLKWIITSGLFQGARQATHLLEFSYFAEFKAKFSFVSLDHLATFIKKIYYYQLQEALQWSIGSFCQDYFTIIELNQLLQSSRFYHQSKGLNCNLIQNKKQLVQPHQAYPTIIKLSNMQKSQSIVNYSATHKGQSKGAMIQNKVTKGAPLPKMIELLSERLRSQDIVSFQRNWGQLSYIFQQTLRTWNMNKYGLESAIRQIVRILDFRIDKFKGKYFQQSKPQKLENQEQAEKQEKQQNVNKRQELFMLYEYFYPKITYLVNQLKKKIAKDVKKNPIEDQQKKMNILDKLLCTYLDEIKSLNQGKERISIKIAGLGEKPLKEFLADVMLYQYNVSQWEDVFNTITINIKRIGKQLQNASRIIQYKNINQSKLSFQAFPTSRCISCTEFYYFNTSIPRLDNESIKMIPYASQIKDYQSKIKQYICDLLNNNGGIILFNCNRQYSSIYPVGAPITEKDKEAYQNQILNLLNFIYPKPEVAKNIVISFIPLVRHPLKENLATNLIKYSGEDLQLKPNQYYFEHTFVPGYYVLRIKVCPSVIEKVYIWQSEDQIYHLNGFGKHGVQTKMSNIRKAIKIKVKKQQSTNFKFRPQTFVSPFCHICKNPLSGVKITEKQAEKDIIFNKNQASLETSFNHVSMVVARHKYHDIIREKLTKRKIICHVQAKFQNYRFRVAQNTAIIYHNIRFDQLLSTINNSNDFKFEGRQSLLIYVTQYLKLDATCTSGKRRIKDEQVKAAQSWLKQEFPKEQLRFFEFKGNEYQKEYYLKTDSRLSTLFIYYVVNNFDIKAIFKNPSQLDRMSVQQRQKVLIEINYHNRPNGQSEQYLLNTTSAEVDTSSIQRVKNTKNIQI